jgi:hypothetical protein
MNPTSRQVVGLILGLFSQMGCGTTRNEVPHREIIKIEVSLEKPGCLIFRVDCLPSSYLGIGSYRLDQEVTEKGRNLCLSIYRAKAKVKGIKEDARRGVEIVFPFKEFNPSRDACWYKDGSGRYSIPIGTRQTWDAYLASKPK